VLGEHPAVREAVVVAREDQPGNLRLVAYVVSQKKKAGEVELREFLKAKLPDYMIPVAFVQLDKLPLTPSGKVDRRALPVPDFGRTASNDPFIGPRTPAEATLAQIWCEVLGVKQVGVHDNFFELGGHSLLVTQVISRVRESFQADLPMRRLFDAPTVAGLAAALEEIIVHEVDELSEDEAQRFADSAS
jgi:acyl carrier protein